MTTEIGGVPIFDLDDPALVNAMERRFTTMIETAPKTLRNRLIKSLQIGSDAGETIQQLRIRVEEVFNISRSPGKSLAISRTESASFMNGLRDQMFTKQGFEKFEWVTAGDEHVRDSHQRLGELEPQAKGTNWLSLIGVPGTLRFPGDPDGPLQEIINCRCIQGPVLT